MKKKLLTIMLLSILCLLLAITFVACDNGEDNGDNTPKEDCTQTGNHDYGDWQTIVEAGCKNTGIRKKTCKNCPAYEEEVIDAFHTPGEWKTLTEKTCTQDGVKQAECQICHTTFQQTDKSEGHTEEITAEFLQATEAKKGHTKGSKCSVCGIVLEESVTLDTVKIVTNKAEFSIEGQSQEYAAWQPKYLYDGDYNVGTYSPKGTNYFIHLDYADGVYISDFALICNGKGKLPYSGKTISAITYNVKQLEIKFYEITGFESDKTPIYAEVFKTGSIDTTTLTEVRATDYGWKEHTKINRITINIQHEKNSWGEDYLWEAEVIGSRPISYCEEHGHTYPTDENGEYVWTIDKEPYCEAVDVNGKLVGKLHNGERSMKCTVCDLKKVESITAAHEWSDWFEWEEPSCGVDGLEMRECIHCYVLDTETRTIPTTVQHSWSDWGTYKDGTEFVTKAPACSIDGEWGRQCTNCGETETGVYKTTITHVWGDWDKELECLVAGTRTRICTNDGCKASQSETIKEGEHLDVVVEGAKEPTLEENGSTGVTKCLACGTIIKEAEVLISYKDITGEADVTTNATHWQVIGGVNSWEVDTIPHLTDGNVETGTPTCPKINGNQNITLTFEEATQLSKIIVTCNGKGNIGYLGNNIEQTNKDVNLTIEFFDAEGNSICKATENTLDKITVSLTNETDTLVKSIKISYPTTYSAYTLFIWEIQLLAQNVQE